MQMSICASTQNFHIFEDYLINLHVNKDTCYTKDLELQKWIVDLYRKI